MKPNVAWLALARRAAISLCTFSLLALPAMAGDRALIDFIGFSPNARYFAFEEFGIQDGSGFAYSNVYVVDLERDSWLPGTPIRQRADDEGTSLLRIRAEASRDALKIIAENDISAPPDLVALIGDGEPDAEATSLVFGRPGYVEGDIADERELALSTFPTGAREDCAGYFNEDPLGFELRLISNTEETILHRDDDTLPQSRGCALGYRLYGVVLPGLAAPQERGVVIVSVYPGGFEGPDRRFLAVPFAF